MFDVTCKKSLESLGKLLEEAARFGMSPESATLVVVGNKIDQYPREVSEQQVSHRLDTFPFAYGVPPP